MIPDDTAGCHTGSPTGLGYAGAFLMNSRPQAVQSQPACDTLTALQSRALSLLHRRMRFSRRGSHASPAALTFIRTPATGASSPILDVGEVPVCCQFAATDRLFPPSANDKPVAGPIRIRRRPGDVHPRGWTMATLPPVPSVRQTPRRRPPRFRGSSRLRLRPDTSSPRAPPERRDTARPWSTPGRA